MVYPIYSKNFFKHTLDPPSSFQSHNSTVFHVNRPNKWFLWHHRLSHPSDTVHGTALSFLNSSNVIPKSDVVTHCKHCPSVKMHKLPFNKFDF